MLISKADVQARQACACWVRHFVRNACVLSIPVCVFACMYASVYVCHRSGLGGVEMFAMGLKATGAYLSRTLSYKDAEFRLEQLEIEPAFR